MSCVICQEEFTWQEQQQLQLAEPVWTLECNHKFHTRCIMREFRERGRCPLCRDLAGAAERVPAAHPMSIFIDIRQALVEARQREAEAQAVIPRTPHLARMKRRIAAMEERNRQRRRQTRAVEAGLRRNREYVELISLRKKSVAARRRLWRADAKLRAAAIEHIRQQ
jgi:hypothetical protein